MVDDNWDKVVHNPILFEVSCKNAAFGDAHLSDTGGAVGEVAHKNRLKLLEVRFFTENDG